MNGEKETAPSSTTYYPAADTAALVRKIVASRSSLAPTGGPWTLRINVSLDSSNVASVPGDDTHDPNDVPPEDDVGASPPSKVKARVTGSNHTKPSVVVNHGRSLPVGITGISLAVTFGGSPTAPARVGTPGDDTHDPNDVPGE